MIKIKDIFVQNISKLEVILLLLYKKAKHFTNQKVMHK